MLNFFKDKKTIYIIIAIALLVIMAIVLTVKPWIKKPVKATSTQLGEMSVLDPVLSADNTNILYYDLNALNIYQYNIKTGDQTQLSDNLTSVPDSLIWSPDRSQVIIKIINERTKLQNNNSVFANDNIEDGATMLWDYNLSTKKLTILNSKINNSIGDNPSNPIWVNGSKNIIYSYKNQDNMDSLYIANPDGSGEQNIGSVPTDLYSIYIYDNQNKSIYYSTVINRETEVGQVYQYNLSTNEKKQIGTNNNFGLTLDNHRFLYGNHKESVLYNISNSSQKTLPINIDMGRTAIGLDDINLVTAAWDQNANKYYIENLNLSNLSMGKILDLDVANEANFTNILSSSDQKIYFVNKEKLFKVNK